ncbi:acyl carrier protein [Acutalibacter sp. 1XD8-36]|jgi:D-alanine--poly(phosphoribitol) ligase subunit 2|uniref:acyl carrier protein n=1 Tax=Acutalibacter sp. 1XD8-36 TaxID=2320852 RepID=UPI001411B336|nr:acyl carrier protein [Acutalibacter sp. 1XD8-36]NBJ90827.1 acyl carrier protein [Acutalibacter sp. 1XD8-36]
MERLYTILEGVCPGIDFRNEKALATDGYIDSFDIVSIISILENEYKISIPVDSMVEENFESAETIMKLIRQLISAAKE